MVIYPLTTVLHDTSEQLGLDLDSFALGQYYYNTRLTNVFKEPASIAAELLGINSTGRVTAAQKVLIREGFLLKNGRDLNMTDKWRTAILMQQAGQKVEPKAATLAKIFLTTLDNEIQKAKVKGAPKANPNNKISLKAATVKMENIIRVLPDVDEMAVKIVATWAVSDWGKKPDMVGNIRASTLLRNGDRFLRYWDIAQSYFAK